MAPRLEEATAQESIPFEALIEYARNSNPKLGTLKSVTAQVNDTKALAKALQDVRENLVMTMVTEDPDPKLAKMLGLEDMHVRSPKQREPEGAIAVSVTTNITVKNPDRNARLSIPSQSKQEYISALGALGVDKKTAGRQFESDRDALEYAAMELLDRPEIRAKAVELLAARESAHDERRAARITERDLATTERVLALLANGGEVKLPGERSASVPDGNKGTLEDARGIVKNIAAELGIGKGGMEL